MIRPTVLLVAAMICAAAASQTPEFMQQYKQRLGGAIDELARVVQHFDHDARTSRMSRDDAIRRFEYSGDPFLVSRGQSMRNTIDRWHDMSDHWRALKASTSFSRLPTFVAGVDSDVFDRTWSAYKPAIPTTLEGLIYSGGGFLLSHLLLGWILSPFRRQRPLKRETELKPRQQPRRRRNDDMRGYS